MPEVTHLHLAVEFHDSEVSVAEVSADELIVRFSAACIHASHGLPGVDTGSVYAQSVELAVANPRVLDPLHGCLGKVSDGEFSVDGPPRSMVPVPFQQTGAVTLTLTFANGSRFTATGSAVRVRRYGEAKFIEHFHC
jgi:hypothetical protein